MVQLNVVSYDFYRRFTRFAEKYLLLQANELNKVRYFEIIKCGDFVFDVSQGVLGRIFN